MKRIIVIVLILAIAASGVRIWELAEQRDYREREVNYLTFVSQNTIESNRAVIAGLNKEATKLQAEINKLSNRPTIVKIPFELVREIPLNLREFTKKELVKWLKEYKFKAYGGVDFNKIDCEDFADSMQRQALYDGYLMSLQLVDDGWHMGNLVMMGNEIWYVEPEPGNIYMKFLAYKD